MSNELHTSPAATAPMWWDGGDRAITAREKATIEEHGPSCFSIALVPASDSATLQHAPAIPDGLDQVYKALDLAADGPFFYVGAQTAAGVGTHFQAQPGSFRLFCGDASFANAHAIVAAMNWLRENREALTATCKQPLHVGEVPGGALLAELLEDSARAAELANRLIAAGPKAAHVSASETHEISDFVLTVVDLLPVLAAPQPRAQVPALTFGAFRNANVSRCEKWHPEGIGSWSPSDWLTAAMGELGELASEVKMHNRVRDGLAGNKEQITTEERTRRMADEAADVVTYLDLFCAERGIDLGAAVVRKFNEVSERVGFPDRLDPATAQGIDLGTGVKAIAAERERQLQAEGFTRDGDQQYRRGELAKAATAYVQLAAMDLEAGTRDHIAWHGPAAVWPWAPEWWKPVDARRDLVRAGALIAAQIDLIDQRDAAPGVANA